MGGRAFDPALFNAVDQCTLGEGTSDDFSIEQCPVCGENDLVFDTEVGQLVNLEDGAPHQCPEA